tara:strand:+ start:5767 stop:6450 length:684 start_codon:yes stop_codon:yes gene_type:complete
MVILSMQEFSKLDVGKKYTKIFVELDNISKKDKNNFGISPLDGLEYSLEYNTYPWRINSNNKYIGFIERGNKIVSCMFAEDDTYFRDKQDCKKLVKDGDCGLKDKLEFMQSECALSCKRLKYKNFKPPKTLLIHRSYTHPKYRGKGLCSILTREFIKKFKDYIIYLNLMKTNLSNINCKIKNGFVILPMVSDNPEHVLTRFPKSKRKPLKRKIKSLKHKKRKKTKRR